MQTKVTLNLHIGKLIRLGDKYEKNTASTPEYEHFTIAFPTHLIQVYIPSVPYHIRFF